MRVIWEVEDLGFGILPNETVIDNSEVDGMTKEEMSDYIKECVHKDFDDMITFYIIDIEFGETK